jgi:hypothetical protein
LEYQDELDWEMRANRRISVELEPSEMSTKMRRAARQRQERIYQEVYCAMRIMNKILLAHWTAGQHPAMTITAR